MDRPLSRSQSRRDFICQSLAAPCFLIPLFRNGALGQQVLAPSPWFAEQADKSGLGAFCHSSGSPAKDYLVETLGSGVALFDYNNDGLVDVFFVNGSSFEILANPSLPRSSSRLFRNNGDGTFTDVTKESGLVNQGWGMGVTVGDYDNDGFRDVFITNFPLPVRARLKIGRFADEVEVARQHTDHGVTRIVQAHLPTDDLGTRPEVLFPGGIAEDHSAAFC